MRYLGGKTRIAKQLAAEIDKVRRPGQLVWDAFCGGLSMSVALSKNGPVLSTDACAPLIALYRAVQAGWDPPTHVSEETWRAAKLLPDSDPMKAFCGFGCSFGGMWFSSFMRHNPGKSEHVYTTRGLLRDCPHLHFGQLDFLSQTPVAVDLVLYLDPPYRGTASYASVAPFDSNAFWAHALEWSKYVHIFVSEYAAPFGQKVFSRALPKNVSGGTGRIGEPDCLFYLPKQNAPEPTSSGAYHPTNLPTEEES